MDKLMLLKQGQKLVVSDADLDEMLASGDITACEIRTIPNPNRVGTLDVYIAWIDSNCQWLADMADPLASAYFAHVIKEASMTRSK